MGQQFKRTCAPTPVEVPSPPATQPFAPPATQPDVPPPPPQSVVSPSFASTYGPGACFPALTPQSMVPSSAPCWITKLQQPGVAGSSAQGPWLFSTGIGASAYAVPTTENVEHPNHALKNTPKTAQLVSNASSSQLINVGDGTNVGNCVRTEKRLPWTKEEDLRLVSAWLNNSNDPIQSNYKKNDQYWNGVAAV